MKYKMVDCGEYFRVIAIKSFGDVAEGDQGGLIVKESNLSQEGNARASGDAQAGKTLITLTGLKWSVTITDLHIQIGCQIHTKEDWVGFEKDQIVQMDSAAEKFWSEYREIILKLAGVL